MALVYIHGFKSSPQSLKAQQTIQWFAEHCPHQKVYCPFLSHQPADAILQLESLLQSLLQPEQSKSAQTVGVVGSSLGGYYATWLSHRFGVKAVLINPAVKPYLLMQDYLGENANYHTGERFLLESHHVQQIRDLEVTTPLVGSNYWVLLQTGDETLDYRQAQIYYRDCHLLVEQGGDHSFQHYDQHLPQICEFLGL